MPQIRGEAEQSTRLHKITADPIAAKPPGGKREQGFRITGRTRPGQQPERLGQATRGGERLRLFRERSAGRVH